MSSKLIYHTNESINGGFSPFDEAIHQVSNSKELLIACPYIDVTYIKPFLRKQLNWRIISDIEAWLSAFQDEARQDIFNFIIDNKYKIHHYKNLHTKVILGDHLCLIGSANLTKMGITQRAEMSIFLDESKYINEIKQWFEDSWSSSSEINITELKDYVNRIITTRPTLENQNSFLNSDAPIIKSNIIAQPEKKANQSNTKKDNEPWNGYYFYVNIKKSEHRNWGDWQKYGFVSGGTKEVYSKPIKNLFPGSRVFVYIPPKIGYVGVGLVTDTAIRVKDFTVLVNGQKLPILDVPLIAPKMDEYVDDLDKSEYLARVEWIKTVPESQAYWEKGLFTNPHTACQMNDIPTIQRLSQHFGLND
ncbi:MAG: phospholipase D-like domain-containing protein [Nostoc sp.]|uniref:phospholipase D-like domain-containing protein n=1 Tax=Nostoc sp. TaxID=1180 RepID=UPI002FF3131B